jgi:hypothetical protein
VSALRATLAALDNAEAARCELSERGAADIVRAEASERLEAAAQLTAPAHADRAARLRAEAAVLLRFLDGPGTA